MDIQPSILRPFTAARIYIENVFYYYVTPFLLSAPKPYVEEHRRNIHMCSYVKTANISCFISISFRSLGPSEGDQITKKHISHHICLQGRSFGLTSTSVPSYQIKLQHMYALQTILFPKHHYSTTIILPLSCYCRFQLILRNSRPSISYWNG